MSTVVLTLIGAKPPKPVNKTLTMGRVEQLSSGKWRKMPFVPSESNGEEGQQTISQLTRDLASCCGEYQDCEWSPSLMCQRPVLQFGAPGR